MDQADFFISYNKADVHWATGIGDWLDQAGYSTILQAQDFVAGSNFVSEMHKAVQQGKRTLAVLSPDYLGARFPEAEWTAAFAKDPTGENRTLITVRVRDCKPPGLLASIVYIDLVGLNPSDAQKRLVSEVQASLSGRRAKASSPRRRTQPTSASPVEAKPSATIQQTIKGNNNTQVAGDYVENKKVVQKNILQPDHRHVDEATAFEIKRLVDFLAEIDVLAGRPDSHSGWYSRLYRRYKVTSYKLIPVECSDDAIQWLRQQVPQQRSKIRRKAPAVWQQQLYKSIWAKAGRLGLEKQEVYDLAFRRLALKAPIRSLKELGEQKLKKLYDIIIRM
jgi:hypothetical protein